MNESVVWSIAGSDPSGGAGLQADIKTFHGLGVYGCAVITAVIAQNTTGVRRVDPVGADLLKAQLDALEEDVPPRVVKIGMLGTADAARVVGECLKRLNVFAVYDPVMISGSGHSLLSPDAVSVLAADLLPYIDLLTPNISEAERLTGRKISTPDDMLEAAHLLRLLGPRNVLIKGGHRTGAVCSDLWVDDTGHFWLNSPRVSVGGTHGTGCTLASAVAAIVARGSKPRDAVVPAKAYVNQGLRTLVRIGRGRAPLAHGGWPADPADMPWISNEADDRRGDPFPGCGDSPLGFYPIVARAAEMEALLTLGVRTIQLRAKDLQGAALEKEVADAVATASRFDARLFINDEWRLAIKHRAYGVHLGVEDWAEADRDALHGAGLRLGASAYTFEELARALALKPSYVGLGAVYATGSKTISTPPLGVKGFLCMRRLVGVPVVAIGGITLERAHEVLNAGADGLAVISDITAAPDPAQRVRGWLDLLRRHADARRVLNQG